MLIGKGLGVLNVEEDLFMSSAHASFFQRAGELWISDGGSASWTWLSIDAPHRLLPGESFSVGMQRLRYLGPLDTAPAEQPWINDWTCSANGAWVDLVVRSVFGVRWNLDGEVTASPQLEGLDPEARLIGLTVQGRTWDVDASGAYERT